MRRSWLRNLCCYCHCVEYAERLRMLLLLAVVNGKEFGQTLGSAYYCADPQCVGLQLSFRQAIDIVPNGPTAAHIKFELNRFRAHLLSHTETNGWRDLFQGKINLVGEQGSVVTQRRALREGTFGIVMMATIQLYIDVHHNLYCGKIRKGQACVPFQMWDDCSDAVRPIVESQIRQLVSSVIRRGDNDRVVKVEDSFLGSQQELRTHFQLPQLQ